MIDNKYTLYKDFKEYSPEEMLERSEKFYHFIKRRRSVREFSRKNFSKEIIKNCIAAAGCAPSGANLQPWKFLVVSDSSIKRQIREAAEAEEIEFYRSRASEEWLEALKPLGTDHEKPFLENAPYLIVIFEEKFREDKPGSRKKNYYVKESVGIAAGFLITALHNAGLVSLTHTPSPMNFLNKILDRPDNEKPFMIIVTGYPAEGVKVPNLEKKELDEIAIFK